MGKYSEALKKIEEERLKKGLPPTKGDTLQKFKPYLVTSVLILIITLVAIYGHGLHQGINLANFRKPKTESIPTEPIPPVDLLKPENHSELLSDVERIAEFKTEPAPTVSEPPISSVPAEPEPVQPSSFYTVQIATFKDREAARSVAKDLLDQGYKAFIVLSGKYFSVSIDKLNKDQAQARLAELKIFLTENGYQDAFVRRIKRKESNS